ncbi:CU044_5270 family protein [Microtetraspora malaysiensis]|uniref:CU044_5270 family protein n=1 Tax=Microtetraspora malaysiensis TaxID=161358 RepID=UPI003D91F6FA
MTQLERFRSEIPQPDPSHLRRHEERLLAAITDPAIRAAEHAPKRWRRTSRLGLLSLAAGLAAAVAAGVVVVVEHRDVSAVIHPMPVAASEVLTRAAENVNRTAELYPKPGQFLVYESQSMHPDVGADRDGRVMRYLSRGKRKVWLPVAGDATGGVIEEEKLPPKQFPGWPIPLQARENVGRSGPSKLADFDDRAEFLRSDYAYVSLLPTEPQKMYEHLYTKLGHGPQDDTDAWGRVYVLLGEAYLPAAQRAALFRAAAAIPGVITVEHAVDAAGRTGIAAARIDPFLGEREEYIFDRETYQYLGMRSVVTDAKRAGAPVGTVLSSSAQLSISVADHAPAVQGD